MATKECEYLSSEKCVPKFTVTWEEDEGYRDKFLNSIIDDIGLKGETRQATYKHLQEEIEADPVMMDIDRDELSISASTFSDGYDKALSR